MDFSKSLISKMKLVMNIKIMIIIKLVTIAGIWSILFLPRAC